MNSPNTIFEKIWNTHSILEEDGQTLLYVDCVLCSEGSMHAFNIMHSQGLKVRRPHQVFGVVDHYVPSSGGSIDDISDPERREMINLLQKNSEKNNIRLFGLKDRWQGIQHILGPEQGLAQPGVIILCGDSHTSTQGAIGAMAFGIGGELAHVISTQTIWQRKPKKMRVNIEGKLSYGVSAKDVILTIIKKIGHGGAIQHAVEYDGAVIKSMSVEERMTVCNMSIEAGARLGIIAPDDKTIEYMMNRPYGPKSQEDINNAVTYWKQLPTEKDAIFDKEVIIDGSTIEPMVTWGNSPEECISIDGVIPNPNNIDDMTKKKSMQNALDYMGLKPGVAIQDIKIDHVFIGSCTNGRIEDLRAAANILKLFGSKKAKVPTLVVPGSTQVKIKAELEGLDIIFKNAGFKWGEAGCSMCVGMNGDSVPEGERCASTSNRNFKGRQGKGSRTHLLGPEMAVAAAMSGKFTDVRKFQKNHG